MPTSREAARKLLGLPDDADRDDLRRAYRKLAFTCHPDRHPGNPEMEKRFKRLGEAYRVLTDEREANKGDTPSGASEAPVPGRDLHYRIRLDFLLSARGGEATIRISRPALCPECAGMGDSDCPRCAGRAEVIIRDGIGVCLPSGLEEGETLRLPGEGAPGRFGGPPGDLYLIASPRNHPAFERRGLDVHSVVQLPAFRLMEGGPVRVFTVQGAVKITIPPRTRPGRIFRLTGWEIARRSGDGRLEKGDHFVRAAEMPLKTEPEPERDFASYLRY